MLVRISRSGLLYTGLAIAIVVLIGVVGLSLPSIALSGGGPPAFSQAGCCSRGSDLESPQGNQTAPQLSKTDAAISAALTYYQQRYGDSSVNATARDLGCHIEVTIIKGDQPIKILSFVNGRIYE